MFCSLVFKPDFGSFFNQYFTQTSLQRSGFLVLKLSRICSLQCVVRVCCIRSFGHFLTNLEGNVLHFNPEAGIFTSISQAEQDNLLQQAKAQFRMVRGGRIRQILGSASNDKR